MSRSPVTPLDARIRCSSSPRFILLQYREPLLRRKNTAKRTGLPQSTGFFIEACQELQDPHHRPFVQYFSPFEQYLWNSGFPLAYPAVERGFSLIQKFRLNADHFGDSRVERETAPVDPVVGSATSFRVLNGIHFWLAYRGGLQSERLRKTSQLFRWGRGYSPAPLVALFPQAFLRDNSPASIGAAPFVRCVVENKST